MAKITVPLHTDASGSGKSFNLERIWKEEDIDTELQEYLKELMILMNELIKKYSASEDFNEYSKKPELWESIKECTEIQNLFKKSSTLSIFKKYTISL